MAVRDVGNVLTLTSEQVYYQSTRPIRNITHPMS